MQLRKFLPSLAAMVAVGMALASHAEAPAGAAKPFFWKVTGGKGVVYLLGTVHAGKADLYPLAPVIETSFKQSDMLIEEIDLTRSKDTRQLPQDILKSGLYQGSDTIANHISDATRKRLAAYAKTNPLGPNYERAKPWLLSLVISQLEIQRIGLDEGKGLDKHFVDEAVQMKKPIGGLETADSQIKLFSSLSDELQDKLLLTTLLEAERTADIVNRMLAAWRSGNAEAMEQVITRQVREHPVLQPLVDKLFGERNDAMTGKIEQYLQTEKTYFVALGAGHLVGERGILQQLQNKRYTIEQP